jgi:transposase-like protein
LKRAQEKAVSKWKDTRRRYADEFKEETVQMMLDGHHAQSVTERLGLLNVNMLYRGKQERRTRSEPVIRSLEMRVREHEN